MIINMIIDQRNSYYINNCFTQRSLIFDYKNQSINHHLSITQTILEICPRYFINRLTFIQTIAFNQISNKNINHRITIHDANINNDDLLGISNTLHPLSNL